MCENFYQFPAVGSRLGLRQTRNRWSPATDADSTAKNTRQEPPMMKKYCCCFCLCVLVPRVCDGSRLRYEYTRFWPKKTRLKKNGNPGNLNSKHDHDLSCSHVSISSCYSTMKASILSSGLLLLCIIGIVSSFTPGGSVRFVGNGGTLTSSQAFQAAGIDALSRKTELIEGRQQRRDTVR